MVDGFGWVVKCKLSIGTHISDHILPQSTLFNLRFGLCLQEIFFAKAPKLKLIGLREGLKQAGTEQCQAQQSLS